MYGDNRGSKVPSDEPEASCCKDEITFRNSSAPTREKDGIACGDRDGDLDPPRES
jgi:hypothetical protein